jgi:hypothetical protein
MSMKRNQYALIVLQDAGNAFKNVEDIGQEQGRPKIRICFVMIVIIVLL